MACFVIPASTYGALPDPSAWPPSFFRFLAAISLGILCLPFSIWGLWIIVKDWGAWKIHSAEPRPHYVRTWHGWVEADTGAKKARIRRRRKDIIRRNLVWRTTNADYRWIFWDPHGNKQRQFDYERERSVLRFVPRWLRSTKHGSIQPDTTLVPNRLSAAEEGKITLRSFRHSCEIQPVCFSYTPHHSWIKSKHREGLPGSQQNVTWISPACKSSAFSGIYEVNSTGTVRQRRYPIINHREDTRKQDIAQALSRETPSTKVFRNDSSKSTSSVKRTRFLTCKRITTPKRFSGFHDRNTRRASSMPLASIVVTLRKSKQKNTTGSTSEDSPKNFSFPSKSMHSHISFHSLPCRRSVRSPLKEFVPVEWEFFFQDLNQHQAMSAEFSCVSRSSISSDSCHIYKGQPLVRQISGHTKEDLQQVYNNQLVEQPKRSGKVTSISDGTFDGDSSWILSPSLHLGAFTRVSSLDRCPPKAQR